VVSPTAAEIIVGYGLILADIFCATLEALHGQEIISWWHFARVIFCPDGIMSVFQIAHCGSFSIFRQSREILIAYSS